MQRGPRTHHGRDGIARAGRREQRTQAEVLPPSPGPTEYCRPLRTTFVRLWCCWSSGRPPPTMFALQKPTLNHGSLQRCGLRIQKSKTAADDDRFAFREPRRPNEDPQSLLPQREPNTPTIQDGRSRNCCVCLSNTTFWESSRIRRPPMLTRTWARGGRQRNHAQEASVANVCIRSQATLAFISGCALRAAILQDPRWLNCTRRPNQPSGRKRTFAMTAHAHRISSVLHGPVP